eukprot:TRINITY_DN10358_c0_g1_i1.p1 TRINITY_DN10358_c0_g1~~TRINITY_DN10358_c0_g1_i1.p1  ORF type:complete len:291 (+),score=49.05 TRINITY_DN10358_c0_g1_i1:3-875(+)
MNDPFLHFEKFPKQITIEIFSFLTIKEIAVVSLVNKYINNLINSSTYGNILWKMFCTYMGILNEEDALNLNEINILEAKDTITFWKEVYKSLNQIKWDKDKKGSKIELSEDRKSFFSGYTYYNWNCVLSHQVFRKGIHYVEIKVDKVDGGYIFVGVATPISIPYDKCIGTNDSALVAGYDTRFDTKHHPNTIKNEAVELIERFHGEQFIGLIIDMQKKQLSYILENKTTPILAYENIPEGVHVFACIANNFLLTFTRHIVGYDSIEKYLKERKKYQSTYIPNSFTTQRMN